MPTDTLSISQTARTLQRTGLVIESVAPGSALARLGCVRVWIGSESGSQRILDAMDRRMTVEQVRAATARLRWPRWTGWCASIRRATTRRTLSC